MNQTISKRILIVDDEQDVVAYLSGILRRANYEVIGTTQGKEVLGLVKRFKPDLIVLDILIPDLDGTDIAASLSQNPSTAKIPIVFLTGALMSKKEEPLKKIGKHYFLVKPVMPKDLLDRLQRALSN